MEEFKSLDQLTKVDPQHVLNDAKDSPLSLENMHQLLANEMLSVHVPNEIQDQFNIIKNMALYSFFCYPLAIEVQLKSYSLIEFALKLKIRPKQPMMLKALLEHALNQQWISDNGFRHIEQVSADNQGCQLLINQISRLTSLGQLGSNIQMGKETCIEHIRICCDFLNQLFAETNYSHSEKSDLFNKTEATDHLGL